MFTYEFFKNKFFKYLEVHIKTVIYLAVKKGDNCALLQLAQEEGQNHIVELILARGPGPNDIDDHGNLPIYYSIRSCNAFMTKFWLSNGTDVRNCPELLRFASNLGCAEIVEMLVEHMFDINSKDLLGRTALHWAVLSSTANSITAVKEVRIDEKIIKVLVKNGADINVKCKQMMSVVHLASARRHCDDVLKVLLECKPDVNAVSACGSPLHIAVVNGSLNSMQMLLKHGADVNYIAENGDTLLHTAVKHENNIAMLLLLQNGAEVNAQNADHYTALHVAASKNNLEIVSILLDNNADMNCKDFDGNTPLHTAIGYKTLDVVKKLLDCGASLHICNHDLHTPLDLAEYLICHPQHLMMRKPISMYSAINIYKTILSHAIMLSAANLFDFRKKIPNDDDSSLKLHRQNCLNEVQKLKLVQIVNNKLSCYNVLTRPFESLAKWTTNEDVLGKLAICKLSKKFPIYATLIERNFEKAIARRTLVEPASELINKYLNMPYECINAILSYLSNDDLLNILKLK